MKKSVFRIVLIAVSMLLAPLRTQATAAPSAHGQDWQAPEDETANAEENLLKGGIASGRWTTTGSMRSARWHA